MLRLYEDTGETDLTNVRRFNEAIDEALTESLKRFALQTDLFRDQFVGVLSQIGRRLIATAGLSTRLSLCRAKTAHPEPTAAKSINWGSP